MKAVVDRQAVTAETNGESKPVYGALAPPGVCKTCDRIREED